MHDKSLMKDYIPVCGDVTHKYFPTFLFIEKVIFKKNENNSFLKSM